MEELLDPEENFTIYEQLVRRYAFCCGVMSSNPFDSSSKYVRRYKIVMHLADLADIYRVHGISKESLMNTIAYFYLPNLCHSIVKELKKAKKGGSVYNFNSIIGAKDNSLNEKVSLTKARMSLSPV